MCFLFTIGCENFPNVSCYIIDEFIIKKRQRKITDTGQRLPVHMSLEFIVDVLQSSSEFNRTQPSHISS